MAEVPVVAIPRSRGAYRAAPSVVRPRPPTADPDRATREWIQASPLALSEARRAWNHGRIGLISCLHCECTRPRCRGRMPLVAETHRRAAGQFLISPAHFDGGLVLRAADRFFVVELCGHTVRQSSEEAS